MVSTINRYRIGFASIGQKWCGTNCSIATKRASALSAQTEAPEGTSSFGFIRFKQLIEQVLGREIDLVSYGPKPKLDDDIRREAVPL